MKNLIMGFVLVIVFPLSLYADVIIFKDGKQIETKSAWEEDDLVKCYRFGQVVGYPKNKVERIEKTEESEKSDADVVEFKPEMPKGLAENYESQIMAYLKRTLYDPYSIRDLDISKLFYSNDQNRWVSLVKYNAKNRMGAYTGIKSSVFIFDFGGKLENVLN